MTLDLTCTECEASFELEVQDLLDAPKTLDCPNCEAKAPARKAEALASAVDDLMRAMKELAPKFSISLTAETDEGQRLRQNSPFPGIIPPEEVWEIKARHRQTFRAAAKNL